MRYIGFYPTEDSTMILMELFINYYPSLRYTKKFSGRTFNYLYSLKVSVYYDITSRDEIKCQDFDYFIASKNPMNFNIYKYLTRSDFEKGVREHKDAICMLLDRKYDIDRTDRILKEKIDDSYWNKILIFEVIEEMEKATKKTKNDKSRFKK